MNSTGKKILSLSVATILLLPITGSNRKKISERVYNNFKIVRGTIGYSKGNIYIGTEDYLKKIKNKSVDDVLVIDARKEEDPDVKILDSYTYNNSETREEIIDALLAYEDVYPTDWNRSRASMIREWDAHNFMHFFGYKTGRTTDVDFNNKDEYQYRLKK